MMQCVLWGEVRRMRGPRERYVAHFENSSSVHSRRIYMSGSATWSGVALTRKPILDCSADVSRLELYLQHHIT